MIGSGDEVPAGAGEETNENGHREAGRIFPWTFTAADLMREDLPPVKWAVPGILPEGLTLPAGKPKLGKSWLAAGLGIAKVSGGVALRKIPVERGEVLYLPLHVNTSWL